MKLDMSKSGFEEIGKYFKGEGMAIKRILTKMTSRERTGVSTQKNENTGVINLKYLKQPYYMNLHWRLDQSSEIIHVGFFEFNIQKCLDMGLIRIDKNGFRFRIIHKLNGDLVFQLNEDSAFFLVGNLKR